MNPNVKRAKASAALLAVIAVTAAFPLEAQKKVGIEEAVASAIENDEGLKQSAISLETKRRALGLAWNSLLPSISATAGLAPSWSSTSGNSSSSLSATSGVSASLSLTADYPETKKLAQLEYENQVLAFSKAKNQLELSARKSVYAILLDKERLATAKQSIARAEESYAQAEAKYKAGLAPELDLLTAKVNLESEKPTADGYATTLANDLDSLKNLMGLSPDEDLDVTGALEVADASVAELLKQTAARADSDNVDVAAAAKAREIKATTKRSLELSSLRPSLSLGASIGPTLPLYSSAGNSSTSISGSASAVLSFPIDNFVAGSSARQKISEAQDAIDIAASALSSAEQSARLARKSGMRSVESCRSSLVALRLNVELSEKAYAATKTAYDKGYTTLSDLRSAAATLESAKLSAISKSYDLIAAILDLEYETGLPFDTIGRLE